MLDGAARTSGERGLPFLQAPEQSKESDPPSCQREREREGGTSTGRAPSKDSKLSLFNPFSFCMLHLLDRSLYAELWKAISRLAIVGVWAEADIIYMLTITVAVVVVVVNVVVVAVAAVVAVAVAVTAA